MANVDFSMGIGPQIERQLKDERVVWLTTVSPDGTPQPNLVWFLWDNGTVLVYTEPDTVRIRNIKQNDRVALNFNSDAGGGQMRVIAGTASLDKSAPPAVEHEEYLAKYREGIEQLGLTPQQFSSSYSVAIRILPTRIRGF